MAFRRMLFEPLRSHHFTARSPARKKLRQENARGSRANSGLTPASQSSSRLKPAGTGLCGLAACTIESATTMARVHEDIWYRKLKGSRTISGGTLGQKRRG